MAGCVWLGDHALAGGPLTNGTAARPQSMQNAFVAIADDASAVYYNPAGISLVARPVVMFNALAVRPSINYRSSSGEESASTGLAVGGSAFGMMPLSRRWSLGVGIFAPAARETEFDASDQARPQSSKILRLDLAPVLTYSWGALSVGGGPVFSHGIYESSVFGFDEKGRGYGQSFQLGVLFRRERLSYGVVYRSALVVHLRGEGEVAPLGRGSFRARQRYPDVLVGGVAYKVGPGDHLTLAAEIELQRWSRVNGFQRQYDSPQLSSLGDSSFTSRDSFVFRLGGAYRLHHGQELRAGYSFNQAAVPAQDIIPSQPDFDISSVSIGYGAVVGRWRTDIGLEHQRMGGRERSSPPFAGSYRMKTTSVFLGLTYAF